MHRGLGQCIMCVELEVVWHNESQILRTKVKES